MNQNITDNEKYLLLSSINILCKFSIMFYVNYI